MDNGSLVKPYIPNFADIFMKQIKDFAVLMIKRIPHQNSEYFPLLITLIVTIFMLIILLWVYTRLIR